MLARAIVFMLGWNIWGIESDLVLQCGQRRHVNPYLARNKSAYKGAASSLQNLFLSNAEQRAAQTADDPLAKKGQVGALSTSSSPNAANDWPNRR
jgi:hypothetical protein